MKLTTFTDYSLRVLIFLAAHPARRTTIAEIASTFDISENHLTKVVHFLALRGWIATTRGKGGGLQLACAAEDINLGEVARAAEGTPMPAECFRDNGGNCLIGGCCMLRTVLGDAVRAFHAVLDRHSLADIVANRRQLARVLTFEAG